MAQCLAFYAIQNISHTKRLGREIIGDNFGESGIFDDIDFVFATLLHRQKHQIYVHPKGGPREMMEGDFAGPEYV